MPAIPELVGIGGGMTCHEVAVVFVGEDGAPPLGRDTVSLCIKR